MKIAVLSALGNGVARRCLDSLLDTLPHDDCDVHVIRERAFREETLNAALGATGTEDDVLFVGDDIEFTHGWYDALTRHYHGGDILGLSMLYPGTGIIQDQGYDLVRLGSRVTLEARDRGRPLERAGSFGIRSCDAVCGCFMLVKAHVFKQVAGFDGNGRNRWGEFIFACQARHQGAVVGVIDHFLYHHGDSTKANQNPGLSSISYQIERELWDDIVRRYVRPEDIRLERREALADDFREELENRHSRMLFFGIGTVTELILSKTRPERRRVAFCSGLPEEVGMSFYGRRVLAVDEAPLWGFDWIIVTPLWVGEKSYRKLILPRLPAGFAGRVSVVEAELAGDVMVYRSRDLKESASSAAPRSRSDRIARRSAGTRQAQADRASHPVADETDLDLVARLPAL